MVAQAPVPVESNGESATVDNVWRERDTTPAAVEAALRRLLVEQHAADEAYAPARVLNLVLIVDKAWSGEVANRLRGVGRYHASRTIVCAVERGRTTIDAVATITATGQPKPGEVALIRETVVLDIGPEHLPGLTAIVDPLVVTDLATAVWAPHGHDEGLESLLALSQIVLLDSIDEPEPAEAVRRARALAERVYVVDLAWLRSTPWRERVAATFDPAPLRPDLGRIEAVTVRHHPDSAIASMLFLGWLAAQLGWHCSALHRDGDVRVGKARAHRNEVALRLEPDPAMNVRGLSGLTIETGTRHFALDRGRGGLRARYRNARTGAEREWTVLGASRGEPGILGEGIRQALLRDPTYAPALAAAADLV